jgi:hypothetical protein
MKAFALIFVLALSAFAQASNEIDSLKTASDVNAFLKRFDPEDADQLALDTKVETASGFGKNTFHKVDINGDGATDLIVEAKYLYAIIWKGDGKHEVHAIDAGVFQFRRYSLVDITKIGVETLFVIRPIKAPDMPEPDSKAEITLVFKYGGFIEYNPKPDNLSIESVRLSTTGCFGSCPIFDMDLKGDRKAVFNAKEFNDLTGRFSGSIAVSDYARVVDIINYIGLRDLKAQYSVPWTDDQGSTLSVTYSGGKKKTISDYGMIGTFGLKLLYRQMVGFRESVHWTKLK